MPQQEELDFIEALELVGIKLLTPGTLEWNIVYNRTKEIVQTKGLDYIRRNKEQLQEAVKFMAWWWKDHVGTSGKR